VERRLPSPIEQASLEVKPKKQNSVKVTNGNLGSTEYDVGSGTYRTLCVRTCDGYYFPVSFSTTSSHFAGDAKECASMCPGAETQLYYHSIPDQEPEEMISLARKPYALLPAAFKYRRDGLGKDPTCTCQAKPALDSADAAGSMAGSDKRSKWVPYPSAKPPLLEDEETRLNLAGSLDAEAIRYVTEGRITSESLANQDTIRVVGPVFLPAQSKAEVPPVPGQSTVR
jgi:hypothetical protein